MTQVSIIGMGNVGSNLASSLILTHSVSELMIYSKLSSTCLGLKLDLDDLSTSLDCSVNITATSEIKDNLESDLVVICARSEFTNQNNKDIRSRGLFPNAAMIKEMALSLQGYKGKVLMVTNPVDVMCQVFMEHSGLSSQQISGVGSNIDSLRYRLILSEKYGFPMNQIEGRVIGEHGDSMVILYDETTFNGDQVSINRDDIGQLVKTRSSVISKATGRTKYGPVGVIIKSIRKILGSEDGIEELSSFYQGGFIGLPCRFSDGDMRVEFPQMSSLEQSLFEQSRAKVNDNYHRLDLT
ncbi:MAG: hypothetical protein WCV90_02015 [Candidatus Woesearchaeota archaeon]